MREVSFTHLSQCSRLIAGLFVIFLSSFSLPCDSSAESESFAPESSAKDDVVKKYMTGCQAKPYKEENCEQLTKQAIEILNEDIKTLGSSADPNFIPLLSKIFKIKEPALRIAVADAIGMIGPQDGDTNSLIPLTNDPVPDVRRAVMQMVGHGKGPSLALLKERFLSMRTGSTPDQPPDHAKLGLAVAPNSAYLFDSSSIAVGRVSYISKGSDSTGFFKGKAKKGPYSLQEFQEKFRYQLQDENEAVQHAQDAAAKQLEAEKPQDPKNMQAFGEYMGRIQSTQSGNMMKMSLDMYQPNLYGSPTVYVLEERQIGQRSYPTRYVVLYQDQALRQPGYRLVWTTVTDDALKSAQVASLKEEQQALARKKEETEAKKKAEELDALTKKKDASEKKQFKKGQSDLEKELGF
jgi:hypothetical protein